MRKSCFPPPPDFFFTPNYYFFNVGNSMKREENMKYWKKILKILFFSIFKKFIKNSNNIPSISKTIQHTPMTWCTYLQKFGENTSMRFWVTVRKLNVADRQTDGQRDGGRCNISRPGPSTPREIKMRPKCLVKCTVVWCVVTYISLNDNVYY